jgi:hypothetical protein
MLRPPLGSRIEQRRDFASNGINGFSFDVFMKVTGTTTRSEVI